MPQPPKPDRERWRILIPSRDASELLVHRKDAALALPEVGAPSQERLAWHLNAELRTRWGFDVVSLFPLVILPSPEASHPARYHVVELLRPNKPLPQGLAWIPVSAITEQAFREADDLTAVRKFLEAPFTVIRPEAPFGHLGWFAEVSTWVQDAIAPFGLHWEGRFEQLHASESFSLLRFETNGGAVWFKAVGPSNARELPITLALAGLFPAHLPRILATHPDVHGWLAEEIPAPRLSKKPDIERWHIAATVLARIQLESIPHVQRLADLGARDSGTKTLLRFVEPYFETMAILMVQQTKTAPAPLSRRGLLQVATQVTDALLQMQELNLPDTLGNFDCNPGNIVVSPEHCVFLDWAEASVGNPFFTFEYLTRHFHQAFPEASTKQPHLLSGYARSWEVLFSPAQIQKALALTPLLALFAHAVCNDAWILAETQAEPRLAAYFRSLTRQMARESQKLQEGHSQCVR